MIYDRSTSADVTVKTDLSLSEVTGNEAHVDRPRASVSQRRGYGGREARV